MRKLYFLLIAAFLIAILESCLSTSAPTLPKNISYVFNVDHLGEPIIVDKDTIEVNEVKLLAKKINLQLAGGGLLQTNANYLIMAYNKANGEDGELVFSANIGYENIKAFKGVELFIDEAPEAIVVSDPDFAGDETNYSFIIKGDFNSENFIYKSSIAFKKEFQFDTVELTNDKQTLLLRVLLDMRDILINKSTDKILNPRNTDNKSIIDSLMQTTIDLEAFATNRFF